MACYSYKKERVFYCTPDTPVKVVMMGITAGTKAVHVVENGAIQGVILDCTALVEEHSYPDSPAAIGQLLDDAVRMYLIATENRPVPGRKTGWIELRNASRQIIARVPVHRSRSSAIALHQNL